MHPKRKSKKKKKKKGRKKEKKSQKKKIDEKVKKNIKKNKRKGPYNDRSSCVCRARNKDRCGRFPSTWSRAVPSVLPYPLPCPILSCPALSFSSIHCSAYIRYVYVCALGIYVAYINGEVIPYRSYHPTTYKNMPCESCIRYVLA